jgi:hypothetical protein
MATRVPYPAVCIGGIAVGLLISFMFGPGPSLFVSRPLAPTTIIRYQPAPVIRQQPAPETAPPHIAELLRTGRFMEAQDAYLEILVSAQGDERAMRGLVAIRRRLSLGDPVLLRRQAEAYGQAAATGGEILGVHYTRAAMAVLAEASLRAAQDIENRQGQKLTDTSPP